MIVNTEEDMLNSKTRTNRPNKKKKLFFSSFIVLFLTCSLFISEIFWRPHLKAISKDIIISIQSSLNQEYLIFLSYVYYLGDFYALVFISLLTYNFSNIYKFYILQCVLHFSLVISGILCIIYKQPRPYYESSEQKDMVNNIKAYNCSLGWANPSENTLLATSFLLTLWHITFNSSIIKKNNIGGVENRRINEGKIIKYIVLLIFIFLILFISLSSLAIGINSLNQIIFGLVLGFLIFFSTFYVFWINVNNPRNLKDHITSFTKIFILIIFLIIAIYFIIFHFIKDFSDDGYEVDKNNSNIERDLYNFNIDNNIYCNPNHKDLSSKNYRFSYNNFLSLSLFLPILFSHLGLNLDFLKNFKKKFHTWRSFNFEMSNNDDFTIISNLSLSFHNKTQWNHVRSLLSFIRLIVLVIISLVLLLPNFLISSDNPFWLVFIFKNFVPLSILYFFMFFGMKQVFKKMGLTNPIFDVIIDSDSDNELPFEFS